VQKTPKSDDQLRLALFRPLCT